MSIWANNGGEEGTEQICKAIVTALGIAFIIVLIIFLTCNLSTGQEEEFSLGHHEGDFEYESEAEAYHDRVEYLIRYKDGCILWFYFDLKTHTVKGWQWIEQVGHGLWG